MDENKRKHLEFIQSAILRMNTNSFFVKSWGLTLVSALFALAAHDSNPGFVFVSYIIIPVFWVLDGWFIAFERRFRNLYDEVRVKSDHEIDFVMNTQIYSKNHTLVSAILSKTLLSYYGISILSTVVVMLLLQ